MGLLNLLLFALPICAHPSRPEASKPPFFVLSGDSTTATQSDNGGGWGDGFLNTTLFNGASGINYGHNGATTVSFREGGDWSQVLDSVSKAKDDYSPYVTIQFGHNDQKAEKNISVAEFTANLEQFAAEVVDAGATPILVTPLSRRNYEDSSDGMQVITENLAEQTAATIQAAQNAQAAYIDLNEASTQYLNEIGPNNAYTYNLDSDDQTHLNVEGSQVFGGIVAMLILDKNALAGLESYIRVDEQLRTAVENGQYYWPK